MSLCTSIFLLLLLPFSNGQTSEDVDTETVLQNLIFKEYNRYRKPVVNVTNKVPFGMMLSLYSKAKVDEKSQTLSSVIWLVYNWKDEYRKWNASQYGIKLLHVPAKKIWVPSICNVNELADKRCMTCEFVKENEAIIYYTRKVTLYNTVQSTIQCRINLQKYPFDEQKCVFSIYPVCH
jgi:hypothetical protein